MHFLNQLFSRYTNPNRHRVKRLSKNLLLESLEQRIALDASGSPTLDALSDLTIDENAPEQTVNLTGITSGGTDVQWLKITAASDNTGLIPNPSVTPSPMTQPPATGVLSFTPVADQFGTAMITVTAENGGPDNNLETPGNNATLTQTFTVYVTQSGAPTLDPLSDLTIDENAPEQTVYLTGITSGGTADVQQLKITAVSDNTGLIPNPTVTPSSMPQPPDPTGVLSFTPEPDQFGTAVITVTAENGGPDNNLATPGNNATLTQTFTVVVTEASNEPDPDVPEVRPQLERVREVHIDNSLAGPDPMVFGKSELVGHGTKSFVITHVAAGSTVEKWDAATNQWRDVSTPPTSSNPRQLLQLLQNRIIQKDDQVRWIPKSTDGVTQKAFEIIGWDDGSEASEPEGVNVPGAVENLAIDIVGDEVRVTWDPPTTGAAVTHYRIHQNPTTVVPSTQTSHTFAKVASPASYAVTVHANSAEGAGEAMTVTLSTGSYIKNDRTVVDPIRDTSGNVLDYNGPNLRYGAILVNVNLKNADLFDANLIRANLTGADLSGANLSDAYLDGAKLIGANLNDANLIAAHLYDAELMGANLTDVKLYDENARDHLFYNVASMNNADLSYANLTGVDLSYFNSDVTLTGTNLTGANFERWRGDVIKSGDITYDGTPPTMDPPWLRLINGYLVGYGTNVAGANLMGRDLTDMKLTNANLTGAYLIGTTLTGADLTNANLSGAYLTNVKSGGITTRYGNHTPPTLPTDWQLIDGYLIGPGADLSGAELAGADLSGADLTGANLASATLTNVKSGGITVNGAPPTLPTGWQLIDGYLIGPGANLNDAHLNGVNMTGADLTGADLSGAYLSGADLASATLTNVKSGGITGRPDSLPLGWQLIDGYLIGPGANLTDADLTGVDLTGMNLTGATLTNVKSGGITGRPDSLPLGWQLIDGYLIGPGADLSGADLAGADLTGANLTNVKSGGITFDGTPPTLPTEWQLIDGYLIGPGADLSGAELAGAYLTGVDLTGAKLSGAYLTNVTSGGITGRPDSLPLGWQLIDGYLIGPGADLSGADLAGADLTGVNLTGATLTNVKSGGITFDGTPPTLPIDWQLIHGYLIGPGADLSGAELVGADLTGVDLTGAKLSGAYLTNVTSGGITGRPDSLPLGWQLFDGYLIGPGADLSGADLAGADLTGVNLTGATLTNVKSGGITVTGTPPALPTDWQLIDGYLIGPTADLTGADLVGADLTGVDLTGANLASATLTNVKSGGITFDGTPPTLPTNWQLIDGYLIGPGANLFVANLANTDLSGADLTGADLSYATLTNVKSGGITVNGTPPTLPTGWQLIDGYLIGPTADLTGADLTGADLSGVNLTGADLSGASLFGANLGGVTMTNATTLTNVESGDITATHVGHYSPPTLPTGWQLIDGYLIGPTADLTGADLSGADLTGSNLASATLTNVKSGGITVNGAPPTLPTNWQLIDGYLIGPRANLFVANLANTDLTDADLSGADLTGADLTDATLRRVTLTGTTLTGATLTGARLIRINSGGIIGTPAALPTNYQLIDGYLIGRNANLISAQLVGKNLTDAHLHYGNLHDANLHDATLTDADLGGAILTSMILTDAILVRTDLTGANLSGANLTGASGAAKYNSATILPAGFDPHAAGWTLVS